MEKSLAGLCGIGIGVYLITVAYRGNTSKLMDLLKEEGPYIEFVISLYAVYLIHSKLPASAVTDVITVTAVTAVILRAVNNTDIVNILGDFASGKKSLLDTAKSIFGYEV